jgi:hypothetical protein
MGFCVTMLMLQSLTISTRSSFRTLYKVHHRLSPDYHQEARPGHVVLDT